MLLIMRSIMGIRNQDELMSVMMLQSILVMSASVVGFETGKRIQQGDNNAGVTGLFVTMGIAFLVGMITCAAANE